MKKPRPILPRPACRSGTGLVVLMALLLQGCASRPGPGTGPGSPDTVLASWVVRTDLSSAKSVDRVLDEAREAGLNTLIVQIRGRGDAWYQSGIEPPPAVLQGTGFDPLERLLRGARKHGLRVHGWVNANLVWNPADPNRDRSHLVNAHPEWLSQPLDLARDLEGVIPARATQPLLEYVRKNKKIVEGLYAEPTDPGYRAHFSRVCRDILRRYRLDGIHLDYIRYPSVRWGYSKRALDLFRRQVDEDLDAEERRDMARRLVKDSLVYTLRYPVRWKRFRRAGVNAMVKSVAQACREVRPGVQITAAVLPDAVAAREKRLQDWSSWLQKGWLDALCPMNYTADRALFERRAAAVIGEAQGVPVWMGIGTHKLEPRETARRIAWALEHGARGIVLFSQGSLRRQPGAFRSVRSAFVNSVMRP